MAFIAAESTLSPSRLLNLAIHIFKRIEKISIIIEIKLNSRGCGLNIFSTELLNSSTPITIMSIDTIKPDIYSILPCPYGCSESAGLDASLKPASVTIDEPASDKLLIASAIIDNDDVRNPAVSFVRNSTILHIIPTIPANIPYSSLTLGFFVSL